MRIRPNSRLQLYTVWEMVTFLLEGFLFVFIGLELPEIIQTVAPTAEAQLGRYVVAIVATVILIRIIWVIVATYIPRALLPALRKKDPYPEMAACRAPGLDRDARGRIRSRRLIALPIALPSGAPFPARGEILVITFCVIFATLVIQGGTLPWVIRWLGIEGDNFDAKEEHNARTQANRAALAYLDQSDIRKRYSTEMIERLRVDYRDRLRQLEACAQSDFNAPGRDGRRLRRNSARSPERRATHHHCASQRGYDQRRCLAQYPTRPRPRRSPA